MLFQNLFVKFICCIHSLRFCYDFDGELIKQLKPLAQHNKTMQKHITICIYLHFSGLLPRNKTTYCHPPEIMSKKEKAFRYLMQKAKGTLKN